MTTKLQESFGALGGGDGVTVVVGANRWDGVRMADRQLADALADHLPVLYVDPPSSIVSRRRDARRRGAVANGDRLRVLRPHLAFLEPEGLPGLARPVVGELNARAVAVQIRRAARRLGVQLRAVIDPRVLSPVLGRCGEPLSIYWAQDDFPGLAPLLGLDAGRLRRGEQRLTARADLVVAANTQVRATVESDGKAAELIPFGCDYDLFAGAEHAARPDEITLPEPYAVFMGHVGDRIDLDAMTAVVERGTRLLVVGPLHGHADASRFAGLLRRPEVQWVGATPFEQLPAYLAHASVGILPYTHSRFNEGSFPLKTLEYLAAGLPVVASDLPAVRWLNCADIAVADDPGGFARAVREHVERGRDRPGDARRRAFAREHTWQRRAAQFAGLIAQAAPSVR